MSRDDGFAVADVDSSKYDDAKMKALWQVLRDEAKMARATALHDATLLASWRHGERLTVREACPLWLTADDELIAALVGVKLIGRDLKVSPASWKHWYGAADVRREVSREKGRLGGLAKAEKARLNSSPATAQPEPGSSPALPVRPSVPTVPTDRPSGPTDRPPDDARDDLEAWLDVKRDAPTPKQRRFLDDYCRAFDVTGPKRAAALIYRNRADPIAALMADLDAFRLERAAGLEDESRTAMERKQAERREPTVLRRVEDPTSDEDAERIAAEYAAKHGRRETA